MESAQPVQAPSALPPWLSPPPPRSAPSLPLADAEPKIPIIQSVTPAQQTLTVAWAAPESDDGAATTAYDLRYIRSDASDKADDNWTVETGIWTGSASLEYTVTGLTDNTEYDLQVRAVNAVDSGPWSTTVTGATMPPPDPCVTELGMLTGTATKTGSWASGCESTNRSGSYVHLYTLTLEEGAEVTIDLTSSQDTYLFLLQGAGRDGAQVESNDDTTSNTMDSQIVETLAAGSYTTGGHHLQRPGHRGLHPERHQAGGDCHAAAPPVRCGRSPPGTTAC